MSYSNNISLEEEIQNLVALQDETAQLFDHADEGQEAVTQLPDVEEFIFTPEGAPDSYTTNKNADTDNSDGKSSKKYSNEHTTNSAKQTEEARKKAEIIRAVRENIRQHAAAHKAKNAKEKEEDSKIKEAMREFQKSKLVSVRPHIARLLTSDKTTITPSTLIKQLENLYDLTDEVIKYNANVIFEKCRLKAKKLNSIVTSISTAKKESNFSKLYIM